MDDRGINTDKLSDLIGLSPRAIISYIYMERNPSNKNAHRINRVLRTEVYEVI